MTDLANKLFLNLSNHPSAQWSAEQMQAAQAYGEVVDMPFPQVSPYADEDENELLVDDYCHRILKLANHHHLTVHLMGEMTFCFSLVCRLQALGITCVASCSERQAEDVGDGIKQSRFSFIRFRRYESITN